MSVSGQFTPGQFTLGNTMPMTVDLVIKTLGKLSFTYF